VSRQPWSGTRARSRDIGYSQGMKEIWELCRAEEKRYEEKAASASAEADDLTGRVLAYGCAAAARVLGELAGYAFDAWVLHDDPRPAGCTNMERRLMLSAGRAPTELADGAS
jgi:hypothetical protein